MAQQGALISLSAHKTDVEYLLVRLSSTESLPHVQLSMISAVYVIVVCFPYRTLMYSEIASQHQPEPRISASRLKPTVQKENNQQQAIIEYRLIQSPEASDLLQRASAPAQPRGVFEGL